MKITKALKLLKSNPAKYFEAEGVSLKDVEAALRKSIRKSQKWLKQYESTNNNLG